MEALVKSFVQIYMFEGTLVSDLYILKIVDVNTLFTPCWGPGEQIHHCLALLFHNFLKCLPTWCLGIGFIFGATVIETLKIYIDVKEK